MGWTRRAPARPSHKAGPGATELGASHAKINQHEAVATLGIDIGKNTFHLVGFDRKGAIALRQKLSPSQVEARLANMPPSQNRQHQPAVRRGGVGPVVQPRSSSAIAALTLAAAVAAGSSSVLMRLQRLLRVVALPQSKRTKVARQRPTYRLKML